MRQKSPAAQAIRDMLECGVNAGLLFSKIEIIHELNAAIGIITKDKSKKKVNRTFEPKVRAKSKDNSIEISSRVEIKRSLFFNPDGTVSEKTEINWDFD